MQRALMVPRVIAMGLLRTYQLILSPLLPSACRFHPTCSEYMKAAIEKHGVVKGVGLGIRRLSRCHPFHQGGFDPVR
jgi:putative membrane protein insertion efficiency factor